MTELYEEYDTYFRKFYGDLFKFQTKTKKQLQCPGCSSKKRFIIDDDKLTFSCGPKHSKDKKCGPQYTIELPKYINFRDLQKVYDEQINGSFDYKNDDILEYDLQKISLKIDVKSDLEKQVENAKGASESLKRLIDDYIETNALNEHIETLKTLSEKRYKNSLAKKKIMRELETEELSAPEKISLRKKYAVLINENQEFIDMIIELRKPNTDFIMIKKPKVIKHDETISSDTEKKRYQIRNTDNIIYYVFLDIYIKIGKLKVKSIDYLPYYKEIQERTDQFQSKKDRKEQRMSLIYRSLEAMATEYIGFFKHYSGKGEFEITQKGREHHKNYGSEIIKEESDKMKKPIAEVSSEKILVKPKEELPKTEGLGDALERIELERVMELTTHDPEKKDKKTELPKEETPKRLSFEDQVKILSEFYAKVDPDKTQSDIDRIINNRRPKGKPKGTRIPTKQWLELCDKLSQKYTFHPLRMNEEKDKFIEEQDDGTKILVDSLSPDSPR